MNGPAKSSSARARAAGVSLALFVGTLLIFGRAIGNGFVSYDDPAYFTANAHVRAGLNWADLRWTFTSGEASNWHPLTWISHLIDWELFGNNPRGPHAVSVVWHALNAVLVFVVFRRLTGAFWTSAFCAALFAWHPLRVESVAWIAERKDVLSGFFALATLWLYAGYVEKRRLHPAAAGPWYALTLVTFAIGLMCKPMLVALPGVLLLLDFWPLRRLGPSLPQTARPGRNVVPWLEKIPFLLLSAASGVVTYSVQKKGGAESLALPLAPRIANAFVSVARYLGKFFWPFDLAPLYPHPGTWPRMAVLGAILLAAAISGIALGQRRRRPWLLTGWLWFLGMIVPVSGLVQVGVQSMADRYTYLPVLGIQLGLLWTVREATAHPRTRRAVPIAALAILLGCAARTWDQIGIWADTGTLFTHAIAVTENNYMADNNLGVFLEGKGSADEALGYFRRAVAIKADSVRIRNNLGSALLRKGLFAEAADQYAEALRLRPTSPEAHANLGLVLAQLGRREEAIQQLQTALREDPANGPARAGLRIVLAQPAPSGGK